MFLFLQQVKVRGAHSPSHKILIEILLTVQQHCIGVGKSMMFNFQLGTMGSVQPKTAISMRLKENHSLEGNEHRYSRMLANCPNLVNELPKIGFLQNYSCRSLYCTPICTTIGNHLTVTAILFTT